MGWGLRSLLLQDVRQEKDSSLDRGVRDRGGERWSWGSCWGGGVDTAELADGRNEGKRGIWVNP